MTELLDRAQTALSCSPIYSIRQLRVDEQEAGCIQLSGRVGSFYHKQLAQEAVRSTVHGEAKLVNSVDVD
jgi:hypothetical protein